MRIKFNFEVNNLSCCCKDSSDEVEIIFPTTKFLIASLSPVWIPLHLNCTVRIVEGDWQHTACFEAYLVLTAS